MTGCDQLLIDGKLVPAADGARLRDVNPATEEVLGVAADASAPRTWTTRSPPPGSAFDTDDWSTDHGLRARCLRQLREALQDQREELRELTIAEVGRAASAHHAARSTTARSSDLGWAADLAESYQWKTDLGESADDGIASRRTVRPRGGRRRRRDHAVELPAPDQPRQARARRWPRAAPSC